MFWDLQYLGWYPLPEQLCFRTYPARFARAIHGLIRGWKLSPKPKYFEKATRICNIQRKWFISVFFQHDNQQSISKILPIPRSRWCLMLLVPSKPSPRRPGQKQTWILWSNMLGEALDWTCHRSGEDVFEFHLDVKATSFSGAIASWKPSSTFLKKRCDLKRRNFPSKRRKNPSKRRNFFRGDFEGFQNN